MKKLIVSSLILLLVASLVISACQPNQVVVTKEVQVVVTKEVSVEKQVVVTPTAAPRGPVTITLWNYLVPENYPQMVPLYDAVIAKFKAAHPDVNVEWVAIPYEGSDAKLTAAFASQTNAPDIWTSKVPYFAGGIGVADPAPADIAKCWDDNVVDVIKPYLKYNEKYYGFPLETDLGMMLYYNKAMFKEAGLDPEKPPKTMDEMLEYAKKLTKADGSQVGFGVRYSGNARGIADKWLPFLHAWGGRLYAEDGSTSEGYLNSPAAIEALQFYGDLVNKYKVSSVSLGKPDDLFLQKRAAMFLREAWEVGVLRDSAPDIEYGVAPLPEKIANPGFSLLFQDGYMVYKFSPNKDLAWELIKMMTCDKDLSLELAKASGTLPTFKSLFTTDPYITTRPDYQAELEILNNPAGPYYGAPYINEISFRVGQAVEEVLFDLKPAKDALNDAVADVDLILAKAPKSK